MGGEVPWPGEAIDAVELEAFHHHIRFAMRCDPNRRHILMSALHGHGVATYLLAVRRIDARVAALPSSDGRSIASVVAHIAQWDRWVLHALEEILCAVEHPEILDLMDYPAIEGPPRSFAGDAAFNAYVDRLHQRAPWERIAAEAVANGVALHARFTDPAIASPACLSSTETTTWSMDGGRLEDLPVGWILWGKTIEHEAFSHIVDLEAAAAEATVDETRPTPRMHGRR
jgi:hypothetical protein